MSNMQLTPSEIVTEIVMSKDVKPWLAVEGDSDERLLRARGFSVPLNIVIGYGWEGVRDILNECAKAKPGAKLLGLIDRDYRDHLNCQISCVNLIITDFRDIENMMFNSSALARVFSEYASTSKSPLTALGVLDVDAIRDIIYKCTVKLGRFRIYCQTREVNFSFKSIEYKKFVCDRTLKIDVNKFIAHLNGKNCGKMNLIKDDWDLAQAKSWSNHLDQPQFIANGHDIMAILCLALRKMWGSNGGDITPEIVESVFRIGYADADLEQSNMWISIENCLKFDQ
jgi:hypothetical protein